MSTQLVCEVIVRVFTLLLALVVAALSDLQGQDQVFTAEGRRVRLKTCRTYADCTYFVGTVTAVGADVIHLKTDSDALVRPFPKLAIRKLELYRGRGPSTKEGALVGALMGGLVLWLASQAGTECEPGAFEGLCDAVQGSAFLGGALLGGCFGAAIGSAIRKDKWDEVPLDRLRVRPIAIRDGRFGLAASVRF